MGNGCSGGDMTPDPSPKRRRYSIIRNRAPSVTSAEMKRQLMRTELEEAEHRKKIAEEMKNEFAKDRAKLKQEMHTEMIAERERAKVQTDVSEEGQVDSRGNRIKNQRIDWNKPESKRIQVVVRTRPLNVREIKEEAKDILYMDEINNECTLLCPPAKQQNGSARKSVTFVFDRVYNASTTTAQIYNEIPYSLVQSFLEGYNSTVLAYGQTGSGKSFTMQEDPDHIGIIPRAIVHIFEGKEADEDQDTTYDVRVSYLEIYNEEIRDILSEDPTQKLEIKGEKVEGLTIHPVDSISSCAHYMRVGLANRVTSATTMNSHSSRSHAIFTVYMRVVYTDPLGHQHHRKAKLNLVDLAGSERHGKTGNVFFCHKL
ncbi:kinesin-like protein KIF17 [Eurytemora carolleeae]|uniref:kinesin-like protein KIF17 n=1 Tax=Eurytemora carolleeae TaxID=1294199 RepID=UPI000C76F07E|nr:kinesin-like protein KIF17 [Eurytemora carolleeae]|eukprot:XP_023331718.1 kinesin-like protein KIF17 [Eurytemora affinis]